MPSSDTLADEVRDLRRTMCDLVALTTLPAVWTSLDPEGIADCLARVLLNTLSLELVYVRLPGLTGDAAREVIRSNRQPDGPDQAGAFRRALAPLLQTNPANPPSSLADPFGGGTLPVIVVRFGYTTDAGILVAGSYRPGFPTERERLLLSVGANQAAIVLQQKRTEMALRENEQRFRNLAQNAPTVVWTAAPDGTITFTSDGWYAYTGLTPEENARDWPRLVLHPDDYEHCVTRWATALREGGEYEIEVRNRRHDGEYRWWITRATSIHDADGRLTAWFGSSTDIHDLKMAQQALRDADRRKNEFLATLAHELRNPLAPIRNVLELLRLAGQEGPAGGELHDIQEVLDRQVNHLVRLVDDLMEVSRISRGKIELRKEVVELAAVVRSAVETSRPLLEAAGHQLTVALPPRPVFLKADPVRLAQVFANLLNNAAKYTENGGRIWLTAEVVGVRGQGSGVREDKEAASSLIPDPWPLTPAVEVRVRDTGLGIPAEMLPRVFEMFTQVNHSLGRAQGGLGIGLSLVKGLVELHGGTIQAASVPDEGSEFTVRLPVLAVQGGRKKEQEDKQPPLAPLSLSGLKVLVADDNVDAAQTLAVWLRRQGGEVRLAHDGRAALDALASFRPRVLVLDLGMPEMDGYEVARRVRRQPEFHDLLLIALTGWGQEEDRRQTQAAGFDHHLVKPVNLDVLQALLSGLDASAKRR